MAFADCCCNTGSMGISDRMREVSSTVQMYENLRPAAQEVGAYEVVGVWVAGVGVEAASGSAFGAGTWLIAVDARVRERLAHGAHCPSRRGPRSEVAGVLITCYLGSYAPEEIELSDYSRRCHRLL